MIIIFTVLLALTLPTHEQSTPISPCPQVFSYEPSGSKPGRWYGVVKLSTDTPLLALWLTIELDSKADLLGNTIGLVTTPDNTNFKIENTDINISPDSGLAVRFFVHYNPLSRTPRLKTIRFNGRKICDANTQPSDNIPEVTVRTSWATASEYSLSPVTPKNRPEARQIQATPQFVHSNNDDDQGSPETSDFFSGGQVTLFLPSTSTNNEELEEPQCGKVTLNNPVALVVNGMPTVEGQWPWQIALYQTQTVNYKYICGGTLVSKKHVITAAHCVTLSISRRVVNRNTLTVYLGKKNLRTSVEGVQFRFVEKITVHPDYKPNVYSRDLAILTLREPVSFTDWVRSACLWPDKLQDLNHIIGKRGSVASWGYDDNKMVNEELTVVEMPVVSQLTCLRSLSAFFDRFTSDYTYCAGFRNGSSVCNGDSGSGMVFELENTWYVRGLVTLTVAKGKDNRCDLAHFVIFTDLAQFLPWIRQQLTDH